MEKIRVLIAEDHQIVREGLIKGLSSNKRIEIVGEAATGGEALKKAEKLIPDVILMDISMPDMDGMKATKKILEINPEINILALSAYKDEEYVAEVINSGAKGYLLKDVSFDELGRAIELVNEGNLYFCKGVSDTILTRLNNSKSSKKIADLTEREVDVLKLIAEGLINKQIADKLFISTKTVINHREHIMSKLNIHSAAGLTKFAIESGVVKKG
jgi:DNA-binding NarL/FixJ family response regulator